MCCILCMQAVYCFVGCINDGIVCVDHDNVLTEVQ